MDKDNITKARKAIVALGTFHTLIEDMGEIKAAAEFDDELVEVNVSNTIDQIVKEYISEKISQGKEAEIKIHVKESVE